MLSLCAKLPAGTNLPGPAGRYNTSAHLHAGGEGRATAPDDAACSVAAVQARASGDTTITAAVWVDGAPRHCLVDGHVRTPGNTVRFGVGLPAACAGACSIDAAESFVCRVPG